MEIVWKNVLRKRDKMEKKYTELARNTGIFAIANFSSKILVFLLVPLYTRVLSTADYGFYDLVYTTVQLFFPILTLDVSEAVMRFLMKDDGNDDQVFTVGLKCTLIGSIVFGIGLLVNYFFNISKLTSEYSVYIFFFFFFYCLDNLLLQYSKGVGQVKCMAVAGVLGTAAMVILNVLFLVVLKWGLSGYFIANIFSYVAPSLYVSLKLRVWNHISKENTKILQKAMFSYSVPLILNTLGWWANNTSDRYIVSAICGVGSNGLISVAYKIPQIITTISAIFIQAWQISAIEEIESGAKDNFISKLYGYFNGFLALISAILILFDKPISSVMFGKSFYTAWRYVPLLIISSLINACAGYVGAILGAKMNSKIMARSALYGIIINIVLNIILTLWLGPIGITIATVIASFVIFYTRENGVQDYLSKKAYFKSLISWVLLTVESVITIVSNFWPINIAITIFILLMYRNGILKMVKEILGIIRGKKN